MAKKPVKSPAVVKAKPPAKGSQVIAPFDLEAGSKILNSPSAMYDPMNLPDVGGAAHALVQFYGSESRITGDIHNRVGVFNPRAIGTDVRLLIRQDPVIA